jgi:MoaE-MoaD fusion protein
MTTCHDRGVKITIRCFASVRELLGSEILEVDVDEGTTVEQLKEKLAERTPDLRRLPVAYAVNQDYAEPHRCLHEGDEVAFIPPISGGSGADELYRFDLTHDELEPRHLEAEVRSDRDGAVVTFAGVTRNHNEGSAVASLRYECYEEMARKVMGQVFEEAVKRFEIGRARVVHRLGEVAVGEASVMVVVAAEHRGPAFEASQFLMDRLKAAVPIFKRELLEDADGGSRWVGELPSGPA